MNEPAASPSLPTEASETSDDTFAPSGRRWADMSVDEILREIGAPEPAAPAPPVPPDWQQVIADKLTAMATKAEPGDACLRTFTVADSAEFVFDARVRRAAG
jgi:hypothetical protein